MQFTAKALFVRYSPYKLRLLANVIRGKNASYAISWLNTYSTKRAIPLKKLVESAIANAHSLQNIPATALIVKDLRVDQGPIQRYFKPGAMGRAMVQRKRLCHIRITLETINKEA